jgi:hypothetical protein
MEYYAAQDAANVFLKGLFLGASVVLVVVVLYILIRQKHFVLMTILVFAVLLVQPVFFLGEIMANCGNAGISYWYYACEFLALLTIFVTLIGFQSVSAKWAKRTMIP